MLFQVKGSWADTDHSYQEIIKTKREGLSATERVYNGHYPIYPLKCRPNGQWQEAIGVFDNFY